MARKKRNLEKVEAIAKASTMMQPPFVMANERPFFQELQQEVQVAIANKSAAPKNSEPERSRPPKSAARAELEIMLARICERQRNAPPLPVPPLYRQSVKQKLVTGKPAHAEGDNDIPLHEMLRQLMRRVQKL